MGRRRVVPTVRLAALNRSSRSLRIAHVTQGITKKGCARSCLHLRYGRHAAVPTARYVPSLTWVAAAVLSRYALSLGFRCGSVYPWQPLRHSHGSFLRSIMQIK